MRVTSCTLRQYRTVRENGVVSRFAGRWSGRFPPAMRFLRFRRWPLGVSPTPLTECRIGHRIHRAWMHATGRWFGSRASMSTIGSGCHELRIIDESVTWRIVCAVEADAIVVLDVFAKKTNKTPK
ncbi:MAG TPA: type II toxin-antitoxin system RelE/ParE family toxin, partial [Candidatus Eisenbacteria bacterium]|nr:type II toxin-antitoxin system RelE/ParE family toxin [Candidatus Eisenbacteria bacterium]